MPDPTPRAFVSAEPVVAASASSSAAVVLTLSILEILEAFDLTHLSIRQAAAIVGLITIVSAFLAGMIARRKVSPTWKLDAVEALVVTPPQIVAGSPAPVAPPGP